MPHRTLRILLAAAAALALCLAGAAAGQATGRPAAKPHKPHHRTGTKKRPHRRHVKHHRRRGFAIRLSNATDSKRVCVYSAHSIAVLEQFDALVGRDVDCVMVFNNASPDWWGWEHPWFTRNPLPDNNWTAWATAPGTSRRLIISQNLFPASENNVDWRTAGARGDYEGHARALAQSLVAAGLGDSVIRLSHEANGDWGPDNIGTTDAQFAQWRQFWRNTVLAMRSVPGAHFSFDWCINARYRPIALDKFYPGDDVVDIIGIDAYDTGVPAGQPRWSTIYNGTDGIGDVVAFARAHGKPLSIPEWGVSPTTKMLGGGDDPAYVDGIASVVRDDPVAYQSYFYKYEFATQLANGPGSLAAYRRAFGATGTAGGQASPAPAGSPSVPPTNRKPSPSRTRPHAKKKKKAHRKLSHKRRRRSSRHR